MLYPLAAEYPVIPAQEPKDGAIPAAVRRRLALPNGYKKMVTTLAGCIPTDASVVEAWVSPTSFSAARSKGHAGMAREAAEYVATYFSEAAKICKEIDVAKVEAMVAELVALRERGGRLFVLGVGGSAANCSHAVNDFRKLCGIEAYTPVDNVSELTARTNDEGWETVFSAWLAVSKANAKDAILVFSVGGGDAARNVSPNIVAALKEGQARGLKVLGVVGRTGGYTHQVGDAVVVVPMAHHARVTPHSEAFQAVIWHCIVSHPRLQQKAAKWEGMEAARAPAAP